jgi:hypothetical protein
MKIASVLACALGGACVAMGAAGADEMQAPAFALPQEVVSAATAFQQYMSGAARIDAGFADGEQVARGLKTASAYEATQMEEGMVAYGAIVALQDDRFVAGVERAAGRGDDRAIFAEQLIQDPARATQVDGADDAARRIEAALGAKASALVSAGTQVKAAAYSVQRQAWSKVKVPDAAGRLSRVKHISAAGYQASREDPAQLQTALAQGARRPGAPSPVVARGVALAALSVLGEDGRARSLMSEPRADSCLRIAKLNLYQCLASAGPHYEDIFCLGQHAMIDPGQCVVEATRAPAVRQAALNKTSYRR